MDNRGERPRKSYDYDFYIATGNVLSLFICLFIYFSLYSAGMLKQVKTEMEKYRLDNAAIQGIRRRRSGVLDTGNFILMCSYIEGNTFTHVPPIVQVWLQSVTKEGHLYLENKVSYHLFLFFL